MTLNIIQLRGLNITEEFFGAKWRFFPSLNWLFNDWDCSLHSASSRTSSDKVVGQPEWRHQNQNAVVPFFNSNLRKVSFSLQFVSKDFVSSIWVSLWQYNEMNKTFTCSLKTEHVILSRSLWRVYVLGISNLNTWLYSVHQGFWLNLGKNNQEYYFSLSTILNRATIVGRPGHYMKLAQALSQTTIAILILSKSLIRMVEEQHGFIYQQTKNQR